MGALNQTVVGFNLNVNMMYIYNSSTNDFGYMFGLIRFCVAIIIWFGIVRRDMASVHTCSSIILWKLYIFFARANTKIPKNAAPKIYLTGFLLWCGERS